jgi:hypothetical protein
MPVVFEMAMLEVDIKFDEARELGLYMARKYGNNLPKQYILLMAVAEVIHLIHVDACGSDLDEKLRVEKSRLDCDVGAVQLSKEIFGLMKKAEEKRYYG